MNKKKKRQLIFLLSFLLILVLLLVGIKRLPKETQESKEETLKINEENTVYTVERTYRTSMAKEPADFEAEEELEDEQETESETEK